MSPYTTSSKSKTFKKGYNVEYLMYFVAGQIETEPKDIPYHLGLDVKLQTTQKYIITITKIEEKAP